MQIANEERKRYFKAKSNRGITLIALVITIIILLILAGITINLALGDDGIIKRAQDAGDEYAKQQDKEIESLNKLINMINEIGTDSGSNSNNKTPVDPQIGEYVRYGIDLNNDGNLDNDWKVFYKNSNGRIFIIAADYAPVSNEELQQAMAKAGLVASDETDETDVKWEELPEFVECPVDIQELFEATEDNINEHSEDENSKCVSRLLCTEFWDSFVEDNPYGDKAIGGPTWEMFWNAIGALGVNVQYRNFDPSSSMYGEDIAGKFIVPDSEELSWNLGLDYLISSPCSYANNSLWVISMYQGYGVYSTDGAKWSLSWNIRPVVCLVDNVKLFDSGIKNNEERVLTFQ